MRQLLTIFAMLLAAVLSAPALSVELPVTPDSLDQYNYKFLVTATPTNTEISFHVIITNKSEDISDDSNVGLSIVTHTKDSKGQQIGTSLAAFTPAIPITLKKDKRVWTADFTISKKPLKTDGLCFIFTEMSHAMINGKRIAMPSATFYEIKLKDFIKE